MCRVLVGGEQFGAAESIQSSYVSQGHSALLRVHCQNPHKQRSHLCTRPFVVLCQRHTARENGVCSCKQAMCAAARTRIRSWHPRTHLRRQITTNRLATAWSWPCSRRVPHGTRGRPAAAVFAKLRACVHDVLTSATNPQHNTCVLACCGVAAFMCDQFDMVLGGRGPGSSAVAAGAVAEGDDRQVVGRERLPRVHVRVLGGVPRLGGQQALLLEPSGVATWVAA